MGSSRKTTEQNSSQYIPQTVEQWGPAAEHEEVICVTVHERARLYQYPSKEAALTALAAGH